MTRAVLSMLRDNLVSPNMPELALKRSFIGELTYSGAEPWLSYDLSMWGGGSTVTLFILTQKWKDVLEKWNPACDFYLAII